MRSARPKPLHMICGQGMVMHVIHAVKDLGVRTHRCRRRSRCRSGHQKSAGTSTRRGPTSVSLNSGFSAVPATPQWLACRPSPATTWTRSTTVNGVIMPGDAPLLQADTWQRWLPPTPPIGFAATLLTSVMDDPTGYGRVIRAQAKAGDGRVTAHHRTARRATRQSWPLSEVCTSIYAFRRDLLGPALRHLTPDNSQGEYYLTDVISVLGGMGHQIGAVQAPPTETAGINDRWQLALAERELRARTNRYWLLNGVTMLDPRQTFIDVTVQLGRDVTLFPGTILQGQTTIGDGCEIGPDTRLDRLRRR